MPPPAQRHPPPRGLNLSLPQPSHQSIRPSNSVRTPDQHHPSTASTNDEPAPHDPTHPWAALFGPTHLAPNAPARHTPAPAVVYSEAEEGALQDPHPPTPGHLDTHISSLTILPGGADNANRVSQACGFFNTLLPAAPGSNATSPRGSVPSPATIQQQSTLDTQKSNQTNQTSQQPSPVQLHPPEPAQPVQWPPQCASPIPDSTTTTNPLQANLPTGSKVAPSGAISGGGGGGRMARLSLPTISSAAMGRTGSLPVPLPMSKSTSQQPLDPAEVEFRSHIRALEPAEVVEQLTRTLKQQDGTTHLFPVSDLLLLDIRPANAFRSARLRGSINICAPSTLLKRRSVTVDQVGTELLGDGDSTLGCDPRTQFDRWKGRSSEHDGSEHGGPTTPATTKKAISRILVLDASTTHLNDAGRPGMGGGGTCIAGLLRKFYDQAFEGQLAFVAGGFAALSALPQAESLLVRSPSGSASRKPPVRNSFEGGGGSSTPLRSSSNNPSFPKNSGAMGFSLSLPAHKGNGWSEVQARDGPATPSSSSAHPPSHVPKSLTLPPPRTPHGLVQAGTLPTEAFTTLTTVRGNPTDLTTSSTPGLTTRTDGGQEPRRDPTPAAPLATTAANPFFDNIRQNRELANGVTEVVPLTVPPLSESERQALPRFLRQLVPPTCDLPTKPEPDERRDLKLAHEFYDIDRQEQFRLNATMARLSETVADPRTTNAAAVKGVHLAEQPDPTTVSDQGKPYQTISTATSTTSDPTTTTATATAQDKQQKDSSCYFPFSIAAALERGDDNRYNNIWPYEHTRVRLRSPRQATDPGSDYLNASFAAPAFQWGSERRYISTQAPLPATYDAFWRAIWEQGVKVIVMLAKEREAGRTQAHAYWAEPFVGNQVRTTVVETVALDLHGRVVSDDDKVTEASTVGGGFFSAQDAGASDDDGPVFIRRVFRLNLVSNPSEVRYVVQVQYLAWPDYFVPDSPDSLLNLVEMVNTLQNTSWKGPETMGGVPPASPPGSSVKTTEEKTPPSSESPGRSTFASTGKGATEIQAPMLVHCSAGVGRTGAFILIDSLLDALRRARRQCAALPPLRTWDADAIPSPAAASPKVVGGNSSSFTADDWPVNHVCHVPLPAETVAHLSGRARQRKRGRSASSHAVAEETLSSNDDILSQDTTSVPHRRTRTRSRVSPPPHMVSTRSSTGTSGGGASARRPSSASLVSIASSSSSIASSPAAPTLNGSSSNGMLPSRSSATSHPPEEDRVTSPRLPLTSGTLAKGVDRAKWDMALELLTSTDNLVKKATETLREQRMSSVQTLRQYVFVHQAILAGTLRDLRRHPTSSVAASKAAV